MSDLVERSAHDLEEVELVPDPGADTRGLVRALLAAAGDPRLVRTVSYGGFRCPRWVMVEAGVTWTEMSTVAAPRPAPSAAAVDAVEEPGGGFAGAQDGVEAAEGPTEGDRPGDEGDRPGDEGGEAVEPAEEPSSEPADQSEPAEEPAGRPARAKGKGGKTARKGGA
ncbi:hypothetical protein ACFFR3_45610 [Nonomuraea salmonea]|uniref:Uncharacterized protein n=1 Tax=Nonomuraea salmonea TaxID=46181 RepID=A0ABV5P2S7_9ACTN